MQLDFTDQVVLVTGASSGIGAAVAREFGTLGAHTVLHYNRNAEGAEETRKLIEHAGGTAATVSADLSESGQAARLVDEVQREHGAIDVLVNNAGDLVRRAPVAELSDEEFQRVMDLNVASVFSTCRQVVPAMQRRGSGCIVNITSVAARTGGSGGSVAYATSKGAVSTFTRGLAKEVAGDGVRVNAIAPGIIATPFHDRHTDDDLMAAMVAAIPMGRAGTPDECVGAVLFLASSAMSGYVTGQTIEVNGGQLTP
ncbi:MAG: SDR family NAD(P)-dependent oxidoreductase [Nocardioidaceae bacterium]